MSFVSQIFKPDVIRINDMLETSDSSIRKHGSQSIYPRILLSAVFAKAEKKSSFTNWFYFDDTEFYC